MLGILWFKEILFGHLFGSCCAIPNAGSKYAWGETKMGIVIIKVLAMWSLVAVMAGFGLGAAIRRGDRLRKDDFLSCVFSSLEALQASRT